MRLAPQERDWSAVLLRATAIVGLVTVLVAAQIAVLYAYLYPLVTPPATGTHPLLYPPLWFSGLMTAATAVVLWRARRDVWEDHAATLAGSGFVRLGVATLTMTGVCETGGVTGGATSLSGLEFGWLWYSQGYASPNIGSRESHDFFRSTHPISQGTSR